MWSYEDRSKFRPEYLYNKLGMVSLMFTDPMLSGVEAGRLLGLAI